MNRFYYGALEKNSELLQTKILQHNINFNIPQYRIACCMR